jgi:hypothetical protein
MKQNYRKDYIEYYKFKEIPKEYHIHHMDLNKKNNYIKNLLLLPSKLHQQYHYYYSILKSVNYEQYLLDIKHNNYEDYYMINAFNKFAEIKIECSKWHDFQIIFNLEKK